MSKKTAQWDKIRTQWLEENPPNHEGYYICSICAQWIPAEEVTLDHIIPRSNAKNYANRHDFSNLQPVHGSCNSLKGSKH